MSGPLWDRGQPIDQLMLRFTTGRDPELDLRLVPHDAAASAAHARMLAQIGVLGREDLAPLLAELQAIAQDAREGRFAVTAQDEDGHTAIENRLTERLGQAGRRIHTGRSRNDQVIAALRLHGREAVLQVARRLTQLASTLAELAQQHRETSIPGYTHTRQAMPSTLGLLLGAHAEGLLEAVPWLQVAFAHLNRSPLGSASGFGVPLPLDRQLVADLLGFDSVQANTIAVQNDRGKAEMLVLGALLGPAQDLGRLASDLIWFSSDELGYIRLGTRVTTGSSIMPNKRNPDVLELVRASAGRLRGWHAMVGAVASAALPSGYHRDLQLTKEPFLEGLQCTLDMLAAMALVLDSIEVDVGRCRDAVLPTTAATDVLYGRVAGGQPFRSAYREVAADPAAAVAGAGPPAELWRERRHQGGPGALDLAPVLERAVAALRWVDQQHARLEAVARSIFDPDR